MVYLVTWRGQTQSDHNALNKCKSAFNEVRSSRQEIKSILFITLLKACYTLTLTLSTTPSSKKAVRNQKAE